ncbi:hypothetical protein QWJ34_13870 [Saccharibacillus sp. CPCC 101409]|uniref:hypothetical protein n=1 Tax=Saccharibacillus sp. CPCC 101409 TaxID=3058041 RepID=UPI00267407D9|nr:hypothetical protein [Saccharibacillus sp. CPCC 101409]MDO3410855.1 hypothetical protein [Saccharibacillus sp. CPCC 101409]
MCLFTNRIRPLWSLLGVLAIAAAALLGGLLAETKPAYACSCALGSLDEKLEWAGQVFAGTVTDVRKPGPGLNGTISSGDPVSYTFEVERAWKGRVYETTTLETPRGSESCGASFTNGQKYLVFARENGGVLTTSLCSGNELYDGSVEPIVKRLGEPVELTAGASPGTPGSGRSVLRMIAPIAAAAVILCAAPIILIRRRRRSQAAGR